MRIPAVSILGRKKGREEEREREGGRKKKRREGGRAIGPAKAYGSLEM